ncbi:MAG TPA: hypothetical protein VD963_08395 [Phycisphaerales bacterium]|nr:hypothetical protein [Phycisphaerales bacterium]
MTVVAGVLGGRLASLRGIPDTIRDRITQAASLPITEAQLVKARVDLASGRTRAGFSPELTDKYYALIDAAARELGREPVVRPHAVPRRALPKPALCHATGAAAAYEVEVDGRNWFAMAVPPACRLDLHALYPREWLNLAGIAGGSAWSLRSALYDDFGTPLEPDVDIDTPSDQRFPTLFDINRNLDLFLNLWIAWRTRDPTGREGPYVNLVRVRPPERIRNLVAARMPFATEQSRWALEQLLFELDHPGPASDS